MSDFFTVIVSNDVFVSLGISIPQDVSPHTIEPITNARIKVFLFLISNNYLTGFIRFFLKSICLQLESRLFIET